MEGSHELTLTPTNPNQSTLERSLPKERTADAVPAARAMRSDVGNVPPQAVLTHTLVYDAREHSESSLQVT